MDRIQMDPVVSPGQDGLVSGDLLEEFCHKLNHLYRSQKELAEYLVEDPGDSVIKNSLKENESSIHILRRKIEILQEELPEFDSRKHLDLCVEPEELSASQSDHPKVSGSNTNQEDDAKDDGLYL